MRQMVQGLEKKQRYLTRKGKKKQYWGTGKCCYSFFEERHSFGLSAARKKKFVKNPPTKMSLLLGGAI